MNPPTVGEQARNAIGDVLYRFCAFLRCLTYPDEFDEYGGCISGYPFSAANDYHVLMFSPWCDVYENRPGYPWGTSL